MSEEDRLMRIERLRWEAEDELRPVAARLESAVAALQNYTDLLEQQSRQAHAPKAGADPSTPPAAPIQRK